LCNCGGQRRRTTIRQTQHLEHAGHMRLPALAAKSFADVEADIRPGIPKPIDYAQIGEPLAHERFATSDPNAFRIRRDILCGVDFR